MRDIRLFIHLTFYYIAVGIFVTVLAKTWPAFSAFVETNRVLPELDALGLAHLQGEYQSAFRPGEAYMSNLFFGTLGALLVMFPVSWVYLSVRTKVGLNQALVKTMLLLPIIVTAVVTIVQNSLALAFSLAGIVAAVRFRHNIRSSADTLFIFGSIGVGLAAGVNALGVALIMTLFFNYTFVLLFATNYGYRKHKKSEKYMRPNRSKKYLAKKKAFSEGDIQEIRDELK